MAQFMSMFSKYLVYQNPLLSALDDDDDIAGPIEKVKCSICEIVALYTKKYEDLFKDLPQFVQTIWGLLTNTNSSPKNDQVWLLEFFTACSWSARPSCFCRMLRDWNATVHSLHPTPPFAAFARRLFCQIFRCEVFDFLILFFGGFATLFVL